MNKTLKVIIFFFFLLVPSVIYSEQATTIASVNLARVLNESYVGKEAKKHLRTMHDGPREKAEREIIQKIMGDVTSVISKIGEEGKYDLILEEKRFLFSKNEIIDITDIVVERYNNDYGIPSKKPSENK